MLPTSRWKLKHTLQKKYADQIECLEGNLKTQRRMAGEFIDLQDFAAVASLHLIIDQDEQEIESLRAKLDLLNDDSYFEKVLNEQAETRDEDDRQDG